LKQQQELDQLRQKHNQLLEESKLLHQKEIAEKKKAELEALEQWK